MNPELAKRIREISYEIDDLKHDIKSMEEEVRITIREEEVQKIRKNIESYEAKIGEKTRLKYSLMLPVKNITLQF